MRNLGLTIVALLGTFASGASETFHILPDDERNLVRFESRAPMESFEGKTHQASGVVRVDPSSPAEAFEIDVQVDLASLDTGIALRNRHMCENHLHTDRFPTGTFRSQRLVEGGGVPLASGVKSTVVAEGTLELHGVPREVRIPLDLTWSGTELLVESRFPVTLSDHDIPRPGFLMMKLGETQTVGVHLVATTAAPSAIGAAAPSTETGE